MENKEAPKNSQILIEDFNNWNTFGVFVKSKWNHEGFQKYFRNMGWVFTARIASMVISFITTALVARHLGPENLGQLSYAVSFTALFGFIAYLGIDSVLSRDLVKYPHKKKEFLSTAFLLKIFSGLIAFILCLISALFFGTRGISMWLIILLSFTFIINAFQVIGNEFQARVKSKYPSIFYFITTLILNILKILVVFLNKGVIYLALILVLESVLGAVSAVFLYKKILKDNFFDFTFNKKIAFSLLQDSWPLIFVSAFSSIYSRVDQVLIKSMIDTASVGLYDAAVRISEVWYFIPGIIVSSMLPAIINAKMTHENMYNRRLGFLALLLVGLSILAAIPTAIFAPFIIKIIYGSEFINAVPVLQIYIWSGVGMSLGILTGSYLIIENFRKILFITSFIAMSSNVILNIIFIPKYGMVGSAWATFISYSLIPLSLVLFKQTRRKILDASRSLYIFQNLS